MDPSEVVSVSDKIIHFSGYAALTVLVLIGWEFTIGVLEPKRVVRVASTLHMTHCWVSDAVLADLPAGVTRTSG